MTLASLERLQKHTNELTLLERRHYLGGHETREDDISHSYSVAMFAWRLNEALDAGLDDEKLLKYSLLHDFVEVYAGDVNSFADTNARLQKIKDEDDSLQNILIHPTSYKQSKPISHTPKRSRCLYGHVTRCKLSYRENLTIGVVTTNSKLPINNSQQRSPSIGYRFTLHCSSFMMNSPHYASHCIISSNRKRRSSKNFHNLFTQSMYSIHSNTLIER